MIRYPTLSPGQRYDETQDNFYGLNTALRIQEGEWAEMENISPRAFPSFAPREKRGVVQAMTSPRALIARDTLCWVDGTQLYINSLPVAGIVLTDSAKELVSMGAWLIVLPDKVYVNTADLTDWGYIDAEYSYEGDVVYSPARVDGSEMDLESAAASAMPPPEPENGDYWIDTSGETDVLKQYSAMSDVWTVIPSVYTRIGLAGVGTHFKQYDGVEINGCEYAEEDETLTKQLAALNGSKIIEAVGDDYIIVTGLLNRVHTQEEATVTVKRKMPSMDFVIESQNRLWGCHYGMADGKVVNEIYASALGDFKNWRQYRNLSTDSYAVTVGTDGAFTGAVTFQGYPTFFKETAMHRLIGAFPAQYRVDTIACRGVQSGSHKSLTVVNERLFYKGRTDVLCYDGSEPVSVSEALGEVTYRDAVGGVYKERYYLSMKADSAWHMFLYDSKKGFWYREDNTQALCFAQSDDELYYIDAATKNLMACLGRVGEPEEAVQFSACSGVIGYRLKDHKYVSRLNIRTSAETGAYMHIYLRYDSRGGWMSAGYVRGDGRVGTRLLPVKPRRCDHFEMKIEGRGDCRILSIAKVLEVGGDGR